MYGCMQIRVEQTGLASVGALITSADASALLLRAPSRTGSALVAIWTREEALAAITSVDFAGAVSLTSEFLMPAITRSRLDLSAGTVD